MNNPIILSLLGTGFSFLGTILGSAMVFIFKDNIKIDLNKVFLGFASGVMIAASVWSLLLPSLSMAKDLGMVEWTPAAIGFLSGGLFLYLLDKIIPHLHAGSEHPEGIKSKAKRSTMLIFAITLHNIPEGMAVGLSFALAAKGGSNSVSVAAAAALALGMALQNFPEGAAISLPLKHEGFSKKRAFVYGSLSGIVEPIAGIIGVVLALSIVHIMPFMLAFAAGAMIYVVVDELVPSAYCEHSNAATLAALFGFCLMMILDVALS